MVLYGTVHWVAQAVEALVVVVLILGLEGDLLPMRGLCNCLPHWNGSRIITRHGKGLAQKKLRLHTKENCLALAIDRQH